MKRLFGSICVLILAATLASAEEGRVPIFEPTVFDFSVEPFGGRYVVTRDITQTAGGGAHVIQFVGSGTEVVDLDLNGFTLLNAGSPGAMVILAQDLQKLTVHNGALVGVDRTAANSSGINATDVTQVIIENVSSQRVNLGFQISRAEQLTVRRCLIRNTDKGVLASGNPGFPSVGVIEDNLVQGTLSDGILATNSLSGITVRRNRVIDAGNYGIRVDAGGGGLNVSGNEVQRSAASGFVLNGTGSCIFEGNQAEESGQVPGPFISGAHINVDGCLILNNVFNANAGEGIYINSDGNRIQGNVFNNNFRGLYLHSTADDNAFGDNNAVGNTDPCPIPGVVTHPGCTNGDVCDIGTGNTSMGANFLGSGPC